MIVRKRWMVRPGIQEIDNTFLGCLSRAISNLCCASPIIKNYDEKTAKKLSNLAVALSNFWE